MNTKVATAPGDGKEYKGPMAIKFVGSHGLIYLHGSQDPSRNYVRAGKL